jgi:site-specific DNA-methyltransferase (adenine-specific)
MSPYYEADGITIYHGDCREIVPELSGVRLVVTDPPYVFGLASTSQEGKAGGWGDLMNNAAFFAALLRDFRRLIGGNDGAVWMFNSWRSFPVIARAAYEAQWPIESLLVWDKGWIGPGGPRGLRPSYELAVLWGEGGYTVVDRSTPDIWREKWSGFKPTGHPAEKPVALVRRMIEAGNAEGAVLDPFMGSGTTLVAAKNLGRRAIGIEIEERYCEIAAERLSQGVLDLGGAA